METIKALAGIAACLAFFIWAAGGVGEFLSLIVICAFVFACSIGFLFVTVGLMDSEK